MRFTFFEVKNFKGIAHIKLDLTKSPLGNIHTFVGLNESGKTTILEALNYFSYKNADLTPLELKGYSIEDIHDLIPISRRDNFTDDIIIKIGVELNDEDEEVIKDKIFKETHFKLAEKIGKIVITQKYPFKDSKYQQENKAFSWTINLEGKFVGDKKIKKLSGFNSHWQAAIKVIIKYLPQVYYFPNFLFDFPDKIYLEKLEDRELENKHSFYRNIIQDILNSLKNSLTIQTHLVDRCKSGERNDLKNMNNVLIKLGDKISDVLFNTWDEIFTKNEVKPEKNKRQIIINCETDYEEDKVYLEISIKDKDGIYNINERSLGFRWFFVFILLTQFKEESNCLYLLDEPASNLHPSAQSLLLKSFERLPSLIYTTHSLHMINLHWLENTYVVANEGINYNDEEDNYNARKTKITLTRYREFLSKYPDKEYYCQPILDLLDYRPSPLEISNKSILVEGKNDFYTIKYFEFIKGEKPLNVIPGTSANNLSNVIALMLGWNIDFIILLDADKPGVDSKEAYIEEFGEIIKHRIFCLDDINKKWKKFILEDLISDDDKEKIVVKRGDKKALNRGIQEFLVLKKKVEFDENTLVNFSELLNFLKNNSKPT